LVVSRLDSLCNRKRTVFRHLVDILFSKLMVSLTMKSTANNLFIYLTTFSTFNRMESHLKIVNHNWSILNHGIKHKAWLFLLIFPSISNQEVNYTSIAIFCCKIVAALWNHCSQTDQPSFIKIKLGNETNK
jgi:hypothetical protein